MVRPKIFAGVTHGLFLFKFPSFSQVKLVLSCSEGYLGYFKYTKILNEFESVLVVGSRVRLQKNPEDFK